MSVIVSRLEASSMVTLPVRVLIHNVPCHGSVTRTAGFGGLVTGVGGGELIVSASAKNLMNADVILKVKA